MTRRRPDGPLLFRLGAVLLVAIVAYTGCGALMPGGSSLQVSASGTGPGVTEDSVKVVFIGTDLTKTASLTGFTNADVGKPKEQVEALAAYINANGGIAGRKLDAVYREYEASNDSPAAETTLCSQITQDDQAFAVVLTGQLQSNARPCYAQRQTLMLDATLIANAKSTFSSLSPYLWTATFPEYDAFASSFLAVLSREKFFEGRDKTGLVAADTPANKSVYDEIVVPFMEEAGIEPTVSWIDTTSLGTLNSGLSQAAVNFRGKKIDRVFFLGGARIAPFFMTSAAAISYTARYGISTFDSPGFMVSNPGTIPPAALKGMVGVGFAPGYDVPDSEMAFPASDAEKNCQKIYSDAGITFKARENARVAFTYCDAALMLQAGAKDLGADLNAGAWGAAAQNMTFSTAAGLGDFGGGNAAGTAYRVLKFSDSCGCFTYSGPVTSLGQ
ncbi:ABC-type branched-subunit amino acid transport system substrate-binding protein [Actinoplanes lutulentus]|uniref:ABC-type branched-subunit amino acid transport system substrate-binding protein n=1 Tax=Actinoplanes lutulentus TaxID=1287878 RepID=A0A327ZIW2_9ACTN|nr:ABC transporter substrate-binding protein [Actinoplanes lutulentus]MBB2944418.1 ABC-type branched-subunit amino acid transport system substrate-binding protein [Actinoplanes lutulentus]RAK42350.1 ABC-type branched-subunit amino acid transport system substrate-binding protein [Actinoplanes lutulentus]